MEWAPPVRAALPTRLAWAAARMPAGQLDVTGAPGARERDAERHTHLRTRCICADASRPRCVSRAVLGARGLRDCRTIGAHASARARRHPCVAAGGALNRATFRAVPRLTLSRARAALLTPRRARSLGAGKMDPYCSVTVGGKTYRTKANDSAGPAGVLRVERTVPTHARTRHN